jgi:hypothetical protein
MKETRITSLCGLPTLLCVVVCTMVVFERADACVHDCGECGEWSESLQECVPYPRSLCVEDSDCGTCGECAGPAPCQCVADEDACTGECDECDTSDPGTYNCYDVQTQCNQGWEQTCETCVDGTCEDDDTKCGAECGYCLDGRCWGDNDKCEGCQTCAVGYWTCEDNDAECNWNQVCRDKECVDVGLCDLNHFCHELAAALQTSCAEKSSTTLAECEDHTEMWYPIEYGVYYECSSGPECDTCDEAPYCEGWEACRWNIDGTCEPAPWSHETLEPDEPQGCRDVRGFFDTSGTAWPPM